jgi:DNA polymerase
MSARHADHLEQLEVRRYALREHTRAEEPIVTERSVASASAVARSGALEVPLMDWNALRATVAGCKLCGLEKTSTQTVFGVGNPNADWMVIGEAPGADEDAQGEPFVGRAGQLLNSMLKGIGLERSQVYIANILKCRPPNNRDPKPEEAAHCTPYLERQIELIAPRLILVVGRIAAQTLLQTDTPIGRMRGRLYHFGPSAVPVVVTYHPAYLLRSPGEKRKAWADLLFAQDVLARGHG